MDFKKEMERIDRMAKSAGTPKKNYEEFSPETRPTEKKKVKAKENEELHGGSGNRLKCFFNNKGLCTKANCGFQHSERSCKEFNDFGFCKDESLCKFRHPRKICKFWSEKNTVSLGIFASIDILCLIQNRPISSSLLF